MRRLLLTALLLAAAGCFRPAEPPAPSALRQYPSAPPAGPEVDGQDATADRDVKVAALESEVKVLDRRLAALTDALRELGERAGDLDRPEVTPEKHVLLFRMLVTAMKILGTRAADIARTTFEYRRTADKAKADYQKARGR